MELKAQLLEYEVQTNLCTLEPPAIPLPAYLLESFGELKLTGWTLTAVHSGPVSLEEWRQAAVLTL